MKIFITPVAERKIVGGALLFLFFFLFSIPALHYAASGNSYYADVPTAEGLALHKGEKLYDLASETSHTAPSLYGPISKLASWLFISFALAAPNPKLALSLLNLLAHLTGIALFGLFFLRFLRTLPLDETRRLFIFAAAALGFSDTLTILYNAQNQSIFVLLFFHIYFLFYAARNPNLRTALLSNVSFAVLVGMKISFLVFLFPQALAIFELMKYSRRAAVISTVHLCALLAILYLISAAFIGPDVFHYNFAIQSKHPLSVPQLGMLLYFLPQLTAIIIIIPLLLCLQAYLTAGNGPDCSLEDFAARIAGRNEIERRITRMLVLAFLCSFVTGVLSFVKVGGVYSGFAWPVLAAVFLTTVLLSRFSEGSETRTRWLYLVAAIAMIAFMPYVATPLIKEPLKRIHNKNWGKDGDVKLIRDEGMFSLSTQGDVLAYFEATGRVAPLLDYESELDFYYTARHRLAAGIPNTMYSASKQSLSGPNIKAKILEPLLNAHQQVIRIPDAGRIRGEESALLRSLIEKRGYRLSETRGEDLIFRKPSGKTGGHTIS